MIMIVSTTYQMEPLVRPHGLKQEVLAVRLIWSSIACIDAYARERGWTRSDATRYLIAKGLEAEGW